jgi:hypothetical protein
LLSRWQRQPSHSKVGDLEVYTPGHQDICRLDVALDGAFCMRGILEIDFHQQASQTARVGHLQFDQTSSFSRTVLVLSAIFSAGMCMLAWNGHSRAGKASQLVNFPGRGPRPLQIFGL